MESDAFNEVVQYSSCVVHFTIALENKSHVLAEPVDPSDINIDSGQLTTPNTTEPLVMQPGRNSTIYSVVPKKCNVDMSGHRAAAKYDLVIDWKNLPLDPRVVKSITAEIHMGLVKPLDFAKGQSTRGAPDPQNARGALRETRSSILNTRRPDGSARTDTLIIRGIVDEWKVDYSSDSYEIHLQGRDLSGVLMDSPLSGVDPTRLQLEHDQLHPTRQVRPRPANNTPATRARRRRLTIFDVLDTSQAITTLVRQILSLHPRMNDLQVLSNPPEWPNGIVPSPTSASRLRRRRGAAGGGGAANMTFWDLITRYCTLVGALPKIVGQHLEIRPSNALFGAESVTRIQDESVRVVYGRDVVKMDITRKYTGNSKPKIIRCVSTDESAGRGAGAIIEAIWPPRNRREAANMMAKNFDARGGAVEGEVLNFEMPGIRDVNVLLSIAQGIYEEIGRNEIRAHVESGRLTSSTGALGDMLKIRPGRSIELLVDNRQFRSGQNLNSTLNETAGMTLQAAARALQPYVGDADIARAMVASHRGIIMEQLRYFYCSQVKLAWTNDKGISVDFDLMNYWWPRHDADRATGSQRMGQNAARRRRAQAGTGAGANRPGAAPPSPAVSDPNTVTPNTVDQVQADAAAQRARMGRAARIQSMLDMPVDQPNAGTRIGGQGVGGGMDAAQAILASHGVT